MLKKILSISAIVVGGALTALGIVSVVKDDDKESVPVIDVKAEDIDEE